MSELRMPRNEGQLEITGRPTILRKKHDCDLKRTIISYLFRRTRRNEKRAPILAVAVRENV